jgi:hypothetical protein
VTAVAPAGTERVLRAPGVECLPSQASAGGAACPVDPAVPHAPEPWLVGPIGAPQQNSRSLAVRHAGMSSDQKNTALRVASVPQDAFESSVESDDLPTVTELAARGNVKRPLDA